MIIVPVCKLLSKIKWCSTFTIFLQRDAIWLFRLGLLEYLNWTRILWSPFFFGLSPPGLAEVCYSNFTHGLEHLQKWSSVSYLEAYKSINNFIQLECEGREEYGPKIIKFSCALVKLFIYPAFWKDFNLAMGLFWRYLPWSYFNSLLKAGSYSKDGHTQGFSFFPRVGLRGVTWGRRKKVIGQQEWGWS